MNNNKLRHVEGVGGWVDPEKRDQAQQGGWVSQKRQFSGWQNYANGPIHDFLYGFWENFKVTWNVRIFSFLEKGLTLAKWRQLTYRVSKSVQPFWFHPDQRA